MKGIESINKEILSQGYSKSYGLIINRICLINNKVMETDKKLSASNNTKSKASGKSCFPRYIESKKLKFFSAVSLFM